MSSDNERSFEDVIAEHADHWFDHEAGWVRIEEFLDTDDIAQVLAICDELLEIPSEGLLPGDKPASGTRHLVRLDERSAAIEEILIRRELMATVTTVLGGPFQRFVASYRSPQPSHGGQYLHADDSERTNWRRETVATAIIALVDFTETNGATRIVPGSHRRPDLQRQAGSLESHPDEILLTGPAGTAFVFSGHLLHSGTPNRSDAERPALQLLWRSPG